MGRFNRGQKKPGFTPDIRIGYFGKGCAGRILRDGESLCAEIWIRFDNPEHEAVFLAFDWLSWANALNVSRCGSASIQKYQIIEKMGELGLPVRISGAPSTHPLF